MIIERRSAFTGKVHTMDLPVTQEQLDRYERKEGLLQEIFPDLTPMQREFIKTGCTQEEWDDIFGG